MFTTGCHNVTDVHHVRITEGLDEGSGAVTLCFHSRAHYDSKKHDETTNEYTFFFKDLEKGYDSLLAALEKAIHRYHAEDNMRFQEKLAKEQSNDG